MAEWWQHLPEHLNPIAFTVGFFSVRWYSLAWLVGFFLAYRYCMWREKKHDHLLSQGDWYDLFLVLFVGVLIGGRLGYFVLYQPTLFLENPFLIVWPWERGTGAWLGFSGMSFHGGLIGGMVALWFVTQKKQLSFFEVADRLALVVPITLFFGRIGNFLNQELSGRLTDAWWGMYFPSILPDGMLRHPSALYEAFGEGPFLFMALFFLQRHIRFSGGMSAALLVIYGMIRFILEYFREPDAGAYLFFGIWTPGQGYSLLMVAAGSVLFWWLREKNHDIIGR